MNSTKVDENKMFPKMDSNNALLAEVSLIKQRQAKIDASILAADKTFELCTPPDSYYNLPQNISFELNCHGQYRTCARTEINETIINKLNKFKTSSKTEVPKISPIEKPTESLNAPSSANMFQTASYLLDIKKKKQNGMHPVVNYNAKKVARTPYSKFVLPVRKEPSPERPQVEDALEKERFSNIDPKMIELIRNEIMNKHVRVDWNDIGGLDFAKNIIKEAIINPMLRPDLFTGIRRPARGILLFGPPGTGKTLIGKCIASNANATFFSISASTLTSKYVGDSEKMVRALFAVAAAHHPSVVFIDEIDSLLSQRSDLEHESARRIKTEFLVQFDGVNTKEDEHILVIGATNRPQDLDEAMRRRLVKRLYIPLPELEGRVNILCNFMKAVEHDITADDYQNIGRLTDGYSGADLNSLCQEAAMGPIRAIPAEQFHTVKKEMLRPVSIADFEAALNSVRPSVNQKDISQFIDWNEKYGSNKLGI